MHFSRSILLSFLLTSLMLHIAICADPLYHICFSQENYTSYSPYESNLNGLLNLLPNKVPPTGFGLGTTGRGQNHVYGLGLCRGDVSRSNCKACVIDAGQELRDRCPGKKGAIIWYDNCLLKYSNVNFFGDIDYENKVYLYNVQNVENPTLFNQKVQELLSSLSDKAYGSYKLYVTGELSLGPSKKLYGLAQCTRDLSGADCKTCLDDAIGDLPNCCAGKRGGRVVGGSCNVRYELYPFVGA